MNPVQIAELQIVAEKKERQKIANNMRLAAAGNPSVNRDGQAYKLWNALADMIERGDFSK